MDVDCDGIDYKCKVSLIFLNQFISLYAVSCADPGQSSQGNPDGQSLTNFGALAAYEVPFIVIPHTFGTTYKRDLPGENIAAVIWFVGISLLPKEQV